MNMWKVSLAIFPGSLIVKALSDATKVNQYTGEPYRLILPLTIFLMFAASILPAYLAGRVDEKNKRGGK